MKIYFDTNVIIAAAIAAHPHHTRAIDALQSVRSNRHTGVIAAHGLAEIYSVLTRAPYSPAIHPSEALQIVTNNVSDAFTVISLSAGDYDEVLRQAALRGISGGRVYDMLHLRAADKSACDRLYTFDVHHFKSLEPASKLKIVSP